MLINDKTIHDRVLSFTKYAQFITNKFGVTVQMNGTEAHTDGKTITIPNIAGMSEKEIDFLYCVVLHEVGHIKYTPFSKESFDKVKTDAHFHLINAIEDARIENSLMKEYDGAHDIFDKLYNHYAADHDFFERVFNASLANSSEFHALSVYIHDLLINLRKKTPIGEFFKPAITKKVLEFSNKNKIEALVTKHPLNSWDDGVALANKIYKLYFGEKKDSSSRNHINELNKTLEDALKKTMDRLDGKNGPNYQDIKDLASKIRDKKQEVEALEQKIQPDVDSISAQQEILQKQVDQLEEIMSNRELLDSRNEDQISHNERVQKKNEQLQDLEKKIQELKAEQNPSDKTLKKTKKLEEKLAEQKKIQTRHEERLNETKSDIQKAQEELNKVPDIKDLSAEELEKKFGDLLNQQEKLYNQMEKVKKELTNKQDEVRKLNEALGQKKDEFAKKTLQTMMDIQESMDKAGIPVKIVPSFEPIPGWDEANSVQQKFDEEATLESGNFVSNGCSLSGSNCRDILTIIEQAKEDLQQIDVGQIFKDQKKISKLDSFNDISQIRNTLEDSEDEKLTPESLRKHIPLTTQFDTVKTKTNSSGTELIVIKNNHRDTIKKIKNIFRLKLKSVRKDRFKGNQEEGGLDQRSLWKLATGTDNNYFEISHPKFINNVAASIAIDISGSMDKDYTEHGKKLKELSLFISEGLTECHVKHEISGFHAPVNQQMRELAKSNVYNRVSNALETVVYKNFPEKTNGGIQNIEIQCTDNSDGESLRVIGGRLIRERSRRKTLFVLTDGKPFLSDSDVALLDRDLKQALEWLKLNNVQVLAFGFNEEGKKFYGDNFCQVKSYQDVLDFLWKKL